MSTYSYTSTPDGSPPLGLVVLQSDETIEHDMRRLLGANAPYVSRVPSAPVVTAQTLQSMEAHIAASAALFTGGASVRGCGVRVHVRHSANRCRTDRGAGKNRHHNGACDQSVVGLGGGVHGIEPKAIGLCVPLCGRGVGHIALGVARTEHRKSKLWQL